MTIPDFKSQEDWEEFTSLFDARWHCKKALLDRVKDDMYPGTSWHGLTSGHMEVINDIVQSLLYDVEYTFCQRYPEYDKDRDDCFIPRRTFKEDVTEALKEALDKDRAEWSHPQSGIHPNNPSDPVHGCPPCPPCDVLQCADHLTDE